MASKEAHNRACRRFKERYPERVKAMHAAHRARVRLAALTYYGGSPPRCACCDEREYKFLSLDHIGGCKTLRKGVGRSGYSLYRGLARQGWPSGFQVLCHNCNLAKGFYGVCPHREQ